MGIVSFVAPTVLTAVAAVSLYNVLLLLLPFSTIKLIVIYKGKNACNYVYTLFYESDFFLAHATCGFCVHLHFWYEANALFLNEAPAQPTFFWGDSGVSKNIFLNEEPS